jgi:hypothetical protein
MAEVKLATRRDGKVSLTLGANGDDVIRVPDPDVLPYEPGSKRARAWQVVSLMDGLTVRQGTDILARLEHAIQRANGRPLGWIADAVTDGHAEIHEGQKALRTGNKACPAPGCGTEFKGNGWDGIDAHWKAKHKDICSYATFWAMVQVIESNAQPARQRRIVVHECEQCGKTFSGVRQARFCSDKCRYDHANARRTRRSAEYVSFPVKATVHK